MRLLLDTHVFLWWADDSARLGQQARDAIAAPRNVVFVSAATIWELVIKQSLGKLELQMTMRERLADTIAARGFSELPVTAEHAAAVGALPWHHRDPFDRLLVAQAQHADLTLITIDDRIMRYDVRTLAAA